MTAPATVAAVLDARPWRRSWRADPGANRLAKRHYNCQSPASRQFVPPGACVTFATADYSAVWVTSWPRPEFVQHAWPGAWINSLFRREPACPYRASALIRAAVAATRWSWPAVPELGMITFVDPSKVRPGNPGYCYQCAGFVKLKRRTAGGLIVWQLTPDAMPEPCAPDEAQLRLFEGGAA